MTCSIFGEDCLALIPMLFLLVPAALYVLGLTEGRAGRYFVFSAVAVHLAGMLYRGLVLGMVPLAEKHDTISFTALSLASAFLYLTRGKSLPSLRLAVLPLLSVILFIAFLQKPVDTISPFMRTPWFFLHTFLFFASYGLFALSFCIGVITAGTSRMAEEPLQYRAAVSGWILYTAALIAGSVWFYTAYGTYWIWTSRELWSTLTWFAFGLYLHARLMRSLRGRPAVILGMAGFLIAVFSYFGVGTVIPSPPVQF